MATSIAERLVCRRFLADAFGGSMEASRLVQNQPLLAGARELVANFNEVPVVASRVGTPRAPVFPLAVVAPVLQISKPSKTVNGHDPIGYNSGSD